MATPVTEFCSLPLKAGSDISNPNAAAGKVWQESIQTLLEQPGCQRCYHGLKVEDNSNLVFLVDWDSYDAHAQFMERREYGPFLNNVSTMLDGAAEIHHVAFKPHPARIALSDLNSPVTEVLTLYFSKSVTQEEQERIMGNVQKFANAAESAPGLKAMGSGWVMENLPHEKGEEGTAKALRCVVGWESIQAHMDYRETKEFNDNIGFLRDAPKLLGLDMFHVSFKESQTGGGPIGAQPVQEEILNPQDPGHGGPSTRKDGTSTKYTSP